MDEILNLIESVSEGFPSYFYTVQRNTCLYVENFIVAQDKHIVESLSSDSQDVPPVSSEFQDINWSREQLDDSNISRIKTLFKSRFCPEFSDLKTESPTVLKYIQEWKKFSLVEDILFRNTILDGQSVRQLVLPSHFKDKVLRHLHDVVGHQSRDRTLSLLRQRFYWPGLESDVEHKVKSCIRCIQRKTVSKPSAELVLSLWN